MNRFPIPNSSFQNQRNRNPRFLIFRNQPTSKQDDGDDEHRGFALEDKSAGIWPFGSESVFSVLFRLPAS